MDRLDRLMEDYYADSDIKPNSPAHQDIDRMLVQCGLDIAAWNFKSRLNSHAARSDDSGGHETCPSLSILFRYTKDLAAEKIDVEKGNWDDEWRGTDTVRVELNKILERHEFGSDFVSSRTFVFISQSWEDWALINLGYWKKDEIKRRITQALRSQKVVTLNKNMEPKYFFWSSAKEYSLVFENKQSYDFALNQKSSLEALATDILSKADRKRHSLSHKVKLSFYHMGMRNLDLYGLSRED